MYNTYIIYEYYTYQRDRRSHSRAAIIICVYLRTLRLRHQPLCPFHNVATSDRTVYVFSGINPVYMYIYARYTRLIAYNIICIMYIASNEVYLRVQQTVDDDGRTRCFMYSNRLVQSKPPPSSPAHYLGAAITLRTLQSHVLYTIIMYIILQYKH